VTLIHVTGTRSPWGRCACGHVWLIHDFDEYVGDDTDLCCADGCDQNGCPGNTNLAVKHEHEHGNEE
jgi:hypothetical protein